MIGPSKGRMRMYDVVKRVLDLVAAAILLVISAPLQLGIAALVRIRLGSPVVFRQARPGRGGAPFTLYKFRTMLSVDESRGLVTNEQRLTAFGKLLRAASLDELPSLVNVVRGDMSLVGPRPLRVEYLSRYTTRQARRHEVRPGITGLAQVAGRNALSWDQRFELDVEYVDTRSLRIDLTILFRTLAQVFRRQGIEGDGLAAMSAFMGRGDDSGLTEVDLAPEWLATRVEWLTDDRVSDGVSLTFVPELDSTTKWFEVVKADKSRRDWIYTDAEARPVAMCGLGGVGTPDAHLYIYVNPSLQGRGYGRAAMGKLCVRARSLGVHRLHLEVKNCNERALSLYRDLGFVDSRRTDVPQGKQALVLDLREQS